MKEPIAEEYPRLREGLVLFTYLHIAADEPLTRALVESGVTAVAYETVETADGRLPLLAPMSEIAGRLAAQAGAYFLEKPLGGRGLLLGGVPGVAPGRVLDHRRRHRRLQRGGHRDRSRRERDDPRSLDRPHAPPRRDPLGPREPRDVVEPADRRVDQGRRRRHRRRPDPRRARAEAHHARDAPRHEGRLGVLRRRDRPGRLRRDVTRRRRTASPSTRSRASRTTASRTCRARCRSRRRRR